MDVTDVAIEKATKLVLHCLVSAACMPASCKVKVKLSLCVTKYRAMKTA